MAMKCAQCGTRLVPGTRSCASCGQQFATEVPPDPIPVQAAAAPPPQAPYGQAPQYGQQPQGQAPQYGQAPMGGPTPGPVGPQDPVKKYGPWVIGAVVVLLGYNYYTSHQTPPAPPQPAPVTQPVTQPTGPTQPQGGPTQPAQPPDQPAPVQPVSQPTGPSQGGGDSNPLVANINLVGQLRDQFVQINSSPQPNDANWKSQMEQNAAALNQACNQGTQYPWPAQISQGQAMYQAALSNYSYVAGRWPAIIEGGDQAGAQDCIAHFKAGDAAMQQLFAYLKTVTGSGGGSTGQGQMQSSLGANFKAPALTGSLNYHPKK
jgi:hypothetical protein